MLNVPFYINRGHRCAQTAMKSALKTVIPERDFSYKELDELTLHSKAHITFPCQIASALLNLEIGFQYFIKPKGLEIISSPEAFRFAKEKYGVYTDYLLRKTEIESLRESARRLTGRKEVVEVDKKPTIKALEHFVELGRIPICLINYDVFVGRENRFNGHYIVITGFDSSDVVYHDNGPKGAGANKICPREIFLRSWDLCFFDHDLIVV